MQSFQIVPEGYRVVRRKVLKFKKKARHAGRIEVQDGKKRRVRSAGQKKERRYELSCCVTITRDDT